MLPSKTNLFSVRTWNTSGSTISFRSVAAKRAWPQLTVAGARPERTSGGLAHPAPDSDSTPKAANCQSRRDLRSQKRHGSGLSLRSASAMLALENGDGPNPPQPGDCCRNPGSKLPPDRAVCPENVLPLPAVRRPQRQAAEPVPRVRRSNSVASPNVAVAS